jgi:hypothetical protein
MERSKAIGASLASILLGGGALALAGFALASATPHQAALQCLVTSPGNCTFHVSTFPDALAGEHGSTGGAHPDWVSYSNFNWTVPKGITTVTVNLNQYDSGGALNDSFFSHVWLNGQPGTAQYSFPSAPANPTTAACSTPSTYGATQTLSKWNTNDVGHTFTLRGIPGNGYPIFVSVPLPADPSCDNAVKLGTGVYSSPVKVTFSFHVNGHGVYQWNCEFPCGGSREGQFGEAMSSYGYMSGTMTVE